MIRSLCRLFALPCLLLAACGCSTLGYSLHQLAMAEQPPMVNLEFVDAETKKPVVKVSAYGEVGDFPNWLKEGNRSHQSNTLGKLRVPLQLREPAIVECCAQGYQRKTFVNSELLAIANGPPAQNRLRVELMPERGPVILVVPEEYRGVLVVRFTKPCDLKDPACHTPVHVPVPADGIVEVKEPGLFVPGHYYPPVQIQRGKLPPVYANDPDRGLDNDKDNLECLRETTLVARYGSLDHPILQTRTDLTARWGNTSVYLLVDRQQRSDDEDADFKCFDSGMHSSAPAIYRQAYFHFDDKKQIKQH